MEKVYLDNSATTKENKIYLHTDSVQAVGNVKIDVKKENIDSLSMSAHKFYGSKGIGALYIKKRLEFQKKNSKCENKWRYGRKTSWKCKCIFFLILHQIINERYV